MYTVALCLSNDEYAASVLDTLEAFGVPSGGKLRVYRFRSSDSLLIALFQENLPVNLIIIDTALPDGSGLHAAMNIFKSFATIKFIFISRDYEALCDAFRMKARGYFVPPVNSAALKKILFAVVSENKNDYFVIKTKGIRKSVSFEDIIYVESFKRIVVLTTKDGVYETYSPISGVEALLPQDMFVRCHKSYIVNVNYIDYIQNDMLHTTTGNAVPIGKSYRQGLIQAYEGVPL